MRIEGIVEKMKMLGLYNERESIEVQIKKMKNLTPAEWEVQFGGMRLKKQ